MTQLSDGDGLAVRGDQQREQMTRMTRMMREAERRDNRWSHKDSDEASGFRAKTKVHL